jgi:ATP-dependent RNA helicase SUPV3L1/SUV3
VRRREAERFASGGSHILVATDAIGMGLNRPARRVLFSP